MGYYSAWMGHHFAEMGQQMGHYFAQMGHHFGRMGQQLGHQWTPMDTKMASWVVMVKR